jgi:hypothetical protein
MLTLSKTTSLTKGLGTNNRTTRNSKKLLITKDETTRDQQKSISG